MCQVEQARARLRGENNQEILMTIMTIEEMTKQKKSFSSIKWGSILVAMVVFLFTVFSSVNPTARLFVFIGAVLFLLLSFFHSRLESDLKEQIKKQKGITTLLEKGSDSLLKDLYDLERQGCLVLEVLIGHHNRLLIRPYKNYVKGRYLEAQTCFNNQGKYLDGHRASELSKVLLAIEALPTGRLVMLEMKMDLSS